MRDYERFKFIFVLGHPFHGLVFKTLCSHMTGSHFTVSRELILPFC